MTPHSMKDKRAQRPYYRDPEPTERLLSMAITLIVGAMLGATIALGVVL